MPNANRNRAVRRPRVTTAAGVSRGFGSAVTMDEVTQSLHGAADPLWAVVRQGAATAAVSEPQLASELYGSVLVHGSLEEAVATVLANALSTASFQATQWLELFLEALREDALYGHALRADLAAVMARDPAAPHAAGVLLYAKGFHALQSWRLSSYLWRRGRHALALYLQSMISARFAVDIHPAATVGSGVLIDHATGIVIGETATLGDNVSLLQNVTLGGTGKQKGDRHPKVAAGVMIGAGATVLGNISIGEGAHIAACSVVLKPIEPFSIVSGVPARVVGKVSYKKGVFPSFVMDQRLSIETVDAENPYHDVVTGDVRGEEGVTGENSGRGI